MAQAHWFLLSKTPFLARSSHAIAVTEAGLLIVYGGELAPRVPVDTGAGRDTTPRASLHVFDLAKSVLSQGWRMVMPDSAAHLEPDTLPEPRVGATAVWYDGALYVWGGRGGKDMAPLDEHQTGVWKATFAISGKGAQRSVRWERVAAAHGDQAPDPRSYHTTVVHGHHIYIHAGCPATGRLSTLHAYDLQTNQWRILTAAPEPGRGGTVLVATTLAGDTSVLLRYGGFCGRELPSAAGELDVYVISEDKWVTVQPVADPVHGSPSARSVHGFAAFRSPKPVLSHSLAVLYHGEGEPAADGHAGAGVFHDDVWLLSKGDDSSDDWDIRNGWAWHKMEVTGDEEHDPPEGRGWFPSASWLDPAGHTQAVMFGGLLGSNERMDELWELEIN